MKNLSPGQHRRLLSLIAGFEARLSNIAFDMRRAAEAMNHLADALQMAEGLDAERSKEVAEAAVERARRL